MTESTKRTVPDLGLYSRNDHLDFLRKQERWLMDRAVELEREAADCRRQASTILREIQVFKATIDSGYVSDATETGITTTEASPLPAGELTTTSVAPDESRHAECGGEAFAASRPLRITESATHLKGNE